MKYYAKKINAEIDSLQNMKGSFEKENTNANVRLEYKVPNLKQKTYYKRQPWKQNQESNNSQMYHCPVQLFQNFT